MSPETGQIVENETTFVKNLKKIANIIKKFPKIRDIRCDYVKNKQTEHQLNSIVRFCKHSINQNKE